ncbi:MAG TPA: DUF429 domain-containing protein [Candidatus Altiarchaeales archaeon]|nr:DUF429 domain-containing protein [Candidatus Altiarchaeales archaeon]
MSFVGIDLAGNPKNETGFCTLEIKGDKKSVSTTLLYSDSEILEKINSVEPEIIAIDAPLTFDGSNRRCDDELREYGALPVTLRGMEMLAIRGLRITDKIRKLNFRVIEVFSTATAKILGLYSKNEKEMQKRLIDSGISGDIDRRFLTKDEIDAIFAAITAYLYTSGSTDSVGDDNSKIIIPRV